MEVRLLPGGFQCSRSSIRRVSGCRPGGWGCKSPRERRGVEQLSSSPGSYPGGRRCESCHRYRQFNLGSLAQLAEHSALNRGVLGASPRGAIRSIRRETQFHPRGCNPRDPGATPGRIFTAPWCRQVNTSGSQPEDRGCESRRRQPYQWGLSSAGERFAGREEVVGAIPTGSITALWCR